MRERGRERLLPVRVPGLSREVAGQELAYIVQTLLDLRLQVEDLRRRMDERPQRLDVYDIAPAEPAYAEVEEPGPRRRGGAARARCPRA